MTSQATATISSQRNWQFLFDREKLSNLERNK